MSKVAIPVLSSGNAQVDRFAEAAKQALDNLSGQQGNSAKLAALTKEATPLQLVNLLNLVLKRMGEDGASTFDALSNFGSDIGVLSALTSINGGPVAGIRNRIRNGGCRISQEGNVPAVASTFTYGGADGFCSSINGTLTGATISQQNSGPSIGAQGFSHGITGATVTTAGSVYFQHRIEAKDTFDLNGKVVTISCRVYQDTGSSIATASLALLKPTTTADTHSAQTTLQTSANQTVPSGVLTTLTFTTAALGASDASLGLAAQLILPFGAAITNKNFTITDWQLEEGPVATKFDSQTPVEIDELRCKRTLECFPVGAVDFIGSNPAAGQNNSYTMPMKVTKRAVPTAIGGAYTMFNAGAPTLSVNSAENVVLNLVNTGAGQWRLTNNTVVKIRCDL